MLVYKLFRVRKDGSLGPLFINARKRIELGTWYEAENHPTRGYAHRPGWHSGLAPKADHLTEKGRTWVECQVTDREYTLQRDGFMFDRSGDMRQIPYNGYYKWRRPAHQGGTWIISGELRPIRILELDEVLAIRSLVN